MKIFRSGVAVLAASGATFLAGTVWGISAMVAAPVALAGPAEPADPASPEPAPGMAISEFAASDPVGFTRWARRQTDKRHGDYRCTLTKQEFVNGAYTEVQKVEVRFRKDPEAVFMIWQDNADQAKRALYIKNDPAYRDSGGQRLAKVEPAGAIARLFVSDIMVEIDGSQAKKASRRTIADVGFEGTFRLLEQYNANAERNGDLDFKYKGEGTMGGRPTYMFERNVPQAKVDGQTYVDAKMVIQIDQEWLVPVEVLSYADNAGTKLLGTYRFSDIDLSPKFTARDFQF